VAPPSRLVLNAAQRQQIFDHCEAERPNEACGLLGGRDGQVERVYLVRNALQSPVLYEIDPADLLRIFRELDDADLDLVGIFHSHVAHEARPSRTDIRQAQYPDVLYVLVSLIDERAPVLKAWTILDGQIDEVEVVVNL
jgi:[CysO sulfur-carrier protein]-S-L-cysteine hydrolase